MKTKSIKITFWVLLASQCLANSGSHVGTFNFIRLSRFSGASTAVKPVTNAYSRSELRQIFDGSRGHLTQLQNLTEAGIVKPPHIIEAERRLVAKRILLPSSLADNYKNPAIALKTEAEYVIDRLLEEISCSLLFLAGNEFVEPMKELVERLTALKTIERHSSRHDTSAADQILKELVIKAEDIAAIARSKLKPDNIPIHPSQIPFTVRAEFRTTEPVAGIEIYQGGLRRSGEWLQLADENGVRIGTGKDRSHVHADGDGHMRVHVYVFDPLGRVVFQKRFKKKSELSNGKDENGRFHVSVGGHVQHGEKLKAAVLREGLEEWGIHFDLNKLVRVSKKNELRPSKPFKKGEDNAFSTVFAYLATEAEIELARQHYNLKEIEFLAATPIPLLFEMILGNQEKDKFSKSIVHLIKHRPELFEKAVRKIGFDFQKLMNPGNRSELRDDKFVIRKLLDPLGATVGFVRRGSILTRNAAVDEESLVLEADAILDVLGKKHYLAVIAPTSAERLPIEKIVAPFKNRDRIVIAKNYTAARSELRKKGAQRIQIIGSERDVASERLLRQVADDVIFIRKGDRGELRKALGMSDALLLNFRASVETIRSA